MQQEVPQEAGFQNEQEPIDQLDAKTILRMVTWSKRQFQAMKSERANVERQWQLNLCFYRGKHNVAVRGRSAISGAAGTLYVPPAPYYRTRLVINRVRTTIRSEMSKLTSQKPTAYILPATSDDDDLFAAQAGEQIWESMYKGKKVPAVFRRALFWNQVCGNAYIRCTWAGDEVDYESNLQGDIKYEAVTPFHLFVPDLTEEDLEAQPYIIYAQLHTSDWVEMHYPNAVVQKKADQQSEILDNAWLDILGTQTSENQKGVLCLEVWIKPNRVKLLPQGGMFLVVGESVVEYLPGTEESPWPFQHKMYPFAKLSHIPSGKFYTDSSLVDLIPLQKEYNRTRSQIIENKNKMSKLQLLAEKGSVDPSKITTEPGQVIEYNMGYQKPEPMPIQGLPTYVLEELDRILSDIADISGQHEVSKGQVPPGVTAATAINYLQEQDDSILSYTFTALEEAFEKVAFMTLSYVQQFWDVPRTVKVTGTDEYFDSMMFKGSDLGGNTDIKIESGSALPLSKSAKQAFIMDLMKMGFIDPMTGLEVMEMGGMAKIYESVQTDVRQAQRENLKMAKIDDAAFQQFAEAGQEGLVVPVNSWDNHQIHIGTHDKYRKGQSFDQLPDGAKQAFEMHVQMHKMAQASALTGENIMEMMKPENMGAIGGAGGEGEQPSPLSEPAINESQPEAPTQGGG